MSVTRNTHLIDIQDDRMNMTESVEHVQKIHTDKHLPLNLTENKLFCQIHPSKFIILLILSYFYCFGHIHRFFSQFQQLIFVGVIFRSCSIIQRNPLL